MNEVAAGNSIKWHKNRHTSTLPTRVRAADRSLFNCVVTKKIE